MAYSAGSWQKGNAGVELIQIFSHPFRAQSIRKLRSRGIVSWLESIAYTWAVPCPLLSKAFLHTFLQ